MSCKRRRLVVQWMTFHTQSAAVWTVVCNCPITGPQVEPLHGAVRSDEQQDFPLARAQKSVCLLRATKPIRAGGWVVGGVLHLWRWAKDGGGAGGGGGGDMDDYVPHPSLPTAHGGSLAVVMMNGGLVSAPGPPLSGLTADKPERKCHSPRACWANLDSAESC